MRPMGMGDLPEEAGLADAGLARDRDDLAVSRRRALEAWRSLSTSASRPTKGVRPRPAAACKRERAALKRITS